MIFIMDNDWVAAWPFLEGELDVARSVVKELKTDPNYQFKGQLRIMQVIDSYANYMSGNQQYAKEDGTPIADS